MHQVLEKLKQDHRNLGQVLLLLSTQLDHFFAGRESDFDLKIELLEYIETYADLEHHPLEDLLYKIAGQRSPEGSELLERLHKLGHQPVSALLEKSSKLRLCNPNTTLPEMLQLLFESPTSLPVVVVEGKKKKLAGMVSNWDVLTKLSVNLLGDKDNGACANAETDATS